MGDGVSFERVVFGRVNLRSAPEQVINVDGYFTSLVDHLTQHHSLWMWDESRPFSGEAWLVTTGAQGLEGYPSPLPSDVILFGTFRRTSHPGEVVLFAIDRQERYIAFTAEEPLSPTEVAGSMHLIFQTLGRHFLGAPEWLSFDVDLVCSREKIFDWLGRHPDVWEMTLWIRHTNPGVDFTEIRRKLIELKGQQEKLTMTAPEGSRLDLDEETVSTIGAETERGHADVRLRAGTRENPAQFDSRNDPDKEPLPEAVSQLGLAALQLIDVLRRRRSQYT